MASSLWGLLNEYKVVVPILQRDYAQGRTTGKVPSIRNNILNALFNKIKTKDEVLKLDFIYGYTRTKTFYPLDGQQRLTTLFLLHWYVAAKEGHLDLARDVLSNFTYETRHSSRIFCSELVRYQPEDFSQSIKKSIINQPWFFTAWINDPTISSMLTMLDSIQQKVDEYDIHNAWDRLTSDNPSVVFHLLQMDELGLPDELYIKMNSRGKELTDFEYLKIRLSEMMTPLYADKFNHKIDQQWSDLFWDLYKEGETTNIAQKLDDGFLRFFKYITDMLIFKNNIEGLENLDEFEIYEKVYSSIENIDYLFKILDSFVIHSENKPDFYLDIFYIDNSEFAPDKTRIFFGRPNVNLFKKCADYYDPKQRNNPFSLGEQLLFYGCIVHILNNTDDFNYRIRKLRNLINNSEDTVRNENISSLLKSVEELIIHDRLDSEAKFSSTQIKEEDSKAAFIRDNPNIKNTIFKLEDHHLLQGCISIFELSENLNDYRVEFEKIFTEDCEYDLISRAMLVFGNYAQKSVWRRLLGNRNHLTWRELFTPSQRRIDFINTQKVLYSLLEELESNPSITILKIVEAYLEDFEKNSSKEKDWNYYFIKYPGFRRHEDGNYYWPDELKPYECIMLRRKSTGGFHWDPFLVSIRWARNSSVTQENYGAPLIYSKGEATIKINTINDCYNLVPVDPEGERLLEKAIKSGIISDDYKLKINQSEQGLDIEDRVLIGIELVDKLNAL